MIDIEQPGVLLRYLRDSGRLDAAETPAIRVLAGGVSNRTVLVTRTAGPSWVVKQALEKLRVPAEWLSDPRRIHREALGLRWLGRLTPPGSTVRFVAEDPGCHLLIMEAVADPHENWKTQLLAGRIERAHVEQFGTLLGTLHARGALERDALEVEFGDRTYFTTLRLDPYYRQAAALNPAAAGFLNALIEETLATRLTLVHGDYSPKNILVHAGRLVLLDHEVIHWGDPAFDLGFSMTHLLAKARHVPGRREMFLEAAREYWRAWTRAAGPLAQTPGLETRAVRHTLACLLSRVDGRSPLEYLTAPSSGAIRTDTLAILDSPPESMNGLVGDYERRLNTT